ncbi:MAG: VOC family protein [Lachnospiraceae bacterium]|nr:VOC family protein [Lachnospiraceae bacterium]
MGIEHTAIYVNDLESQKDFFVRYFDGRANEKYVNTGRGVTAYMISFPDGSRLELMNKAGIEEICPQRYLGFVHIAFSVGDEQKVTELTWRLHDDGYDIASEPRVNGGGYFESSILDKEGNLIELTI